MRTLKFLLAHSAKHKVRVNQLYFIGAFLKDYVKHIYVVKLDSRYGKYLPEYANYFGISLSLKNSIYLMTNYGNLFSDELTNWLMDKSGFNQSKCQISIYYKYSPDGSRLVVLSYVGDCVCFYTCE